MKYATLLLVALLCGGSALAQTQPSASPSMEELERAQQRAAEARRAEEARKAEEARQAEEAGQAAVASLLADLVGIPGGSFQMGSSDDEKEKPVHTVVVRPFRLMKHEVTFAQYDAFARSTGRELPGDGGWGRGKQPVINVSWEDAQAFADWMSKQTSQRWRLPTEVEWEYAARAGTTTNYAWGDDFDSSRANNNGSKTVPVGSYPANAWGLHDMSGNVWEWTQDCWNDSYEGAPTDGSAWTRGDCSRGVIRSGSWYSNPAWLRVSFRWPGTALRFDVEGLRLAQDL